MRASGPLAIARHQLIDGATSVLVADAVCGVFVAILTSIELLADM
jgi:hypothetical protein